MRIIGGIFRGRELKTPRGESTRPTSGMVRETLFNILSGQMAESRFLDLYAGCGSVGLEALSRGASATVLVEQARPALACLNENTAKLGVAASARVLPLPVDRALESLAKSKEQFDIIFLDPPFADVAAYLRVTARVAQLHLLDPDGTLIAQHDARVELPEQIDSLTRTRLKRIGDNALSFYSINVDKESTT